MANKFWVGSTATWDATAGTKWATTSGGAGGAAVPTAADDVFFDAASGAVTVTMAATGTVCRSFDATGFTGTWDRTGNTLAVGDASGGAFKLVAGMTYTITSSVLNLVSTSNNAGAGWAITTGGKLMGPTVFNGALGRWTLQDAYTTGGTSPVTLTQGTLDTNNQACSWAFFVSNGTLTRALTLGTSVITITSRDSTTALGWDMAATGCTLSAGTSSIRLTGFGGCWSSSSLHTYSDVQMTGGANQQVSGTLNCATFTRIGTALTTDQLGLLTSQTAVIVASGLVTLTGNSTTNRLLVLNTGSGLNGPGFPRSISAGSVSLTNVDFQDITGTGAASWTGTSIGDCGGNTGILFDAAVTRYAVTAGNYSSTAVWSATSGGGTGVSVPLPQDSVFFDAASGAGTYTANMPRLGKDVNFTGFTRTFTPSVNYTVFGSLTYSTGMTLGSGVSTTLGGRGTHTLTSAGKVNGNLFIAAGAGTYNMQDAIIIGTGAGGGVFLNSGTFNTNNFNILASSIQANAPGTMNAGTSVLTMGVTTATFSWNCTSTTSNFASATFIISSASANSRTFGGFGRTYGTLTYNVANSTGALVVTGANTFSNVNFGTGRTITWPASTTNTINGTVVAGDLHQGYLYINGAGVATTPDSAAVSVTGDMDIRVRVALDSWTAAGFQTLVGKDNAGSSRSYVFWVTPTGGLGTRLSTDGTAFTDNNSSVVTGFAAGTTNWVRVTRTASTGVLKFWTASGALTSPVAANFTQLGTDIAGPAGALFDATSLLTFGGRTDTGGSDAAIGRFHRAQIFSGIDGTVVFDADFTAPSPTRTTFTESSANAATVTITPIATFGATKFNSSTGGTQATLAGTATATIFHATLTDIVGPAGWSVRNTVDSRTNSTGLPFLQISETSTAGGNSDAAASWLDAAIPTTARETYLAASSGPLTIPAAVTLACRSFTATAYVGTFTYGASTSVLQVGDSLGGSVTLGAGMTVTLAAGSTGLLNMVPTTGGTVTLTTNGKVLAAVQLAAGATTTVQVGSALTLGANISHVSGSFNTGNFNVSSTAFNSSNSNVRSLTFGTSTITLTGASSNVWDSLTDTNLTTSLASCTLIFTGSFVSFRAGTGGNPKTWGTVRFTGLSPTIATGTNFYTNLEVIGTAVKTGVFLLGTAAAQTVTGTFTVTGNSVTNRLVMNANEPGTNRIVTAAAVAFSNVDIMDCTIAGAAAGQAVGTSVGDAGGNTGILFTAPVTRYAVAAGNWSSTAMWSDVSAGAAGQTVPLPQDTVFLNAAAGAGTYVLDMPRIGSNLDCTGFTRTLGLTANVTMYGSLTLATGMTLTGTFSFLLGGRGTHTVTSAGKTLISGLQMNGANGTYSLLDAYNSAGAFTHNNGTWNTGNFPMTMSNFTSTSGLTRTINGGTSTFNITTAAAITFWSMSNTGHTYNMAGTTVVLTAASTGTRTFAGATGFVHGTINYTVANSPGALYFTGASTYTNVIVGPGRADIWQSGVTNTLASYSGAGVQNGFLYLPGVAGHNATSPDSAALSVTGDIDIRARVALDDWTPAAINQIISKYPPGARAYGMNIDTLGKIAFVGSTDGANADLAATSSAAVGVADGAILWVRATRVASTGVVKFLTASGALANPIATDFTQLGTDIPALAGAIFDSTGTLDIGSHATNTNPMAGKFYRCQIRDGIDGTLVFDADFVNKVTGTDTFIESSAQAATVTINGDLARAGDGRVLHRGDSTGVQAKMYMSGPEAAFIEGYASYRDIDVRRPSRTSAVIVSDDFSEANGTDIHNKVTDTGQTWSGTAGTWSVSNGTALSSSAGGTVLLAETGTEDPAVTATMKTTTVAVRLLARATDANNYYYVNTTPTAIGINKSVAGVLTNLTSLSITRAANDVVTFSVFGSLLQVMFNGVLILAVNDTSILTGTKVGFHSTTGGSLDDFSVRRILSHDGNRVRVRRDRATLVSNAVGLMLTPNPNELRVGQTFRSL